MIKKLTKEQQKAKDLLDYLIANPKIRYWQAIRNLSKYHRIYGAKDEPSDIEDTFYKE